MGGSGTSGLEDQPLGVAFMIADNDQIESAGKQQESGMGMGGAPRKTRTARSSRPSNPGPPSTGAKS